MDMNFQEVKREVQNANDAVNLGFSTLNSTICNQQYDTARMINGLGNTVQQGFNAQTIATLQGQNALSALISGCCCDAQQTMSTINNNISNQACDTRYAMQTLTRDIITNQNDNARAILDKLTAQELAAKDAENANLRAQLAACGDKATAQYIINEVRGFVNPQPVPAYPAPSPCGLGNWAPQVLANSYGCNNCGCN